MKKFIPLFLICIYLFVLLCSCQDKNDQLEEQKAELKELRCKKDHLQRVIDYRTNTMSLAKELKMVDELQEYYELASDTTKSCEEMKMDWINFRDKVDSNYKCLPK